jgi:outer membrane lipoprotein-sorting protein
VKRILSVCILLLVASTASLATQKIKSGEDVIRAMRDRYAGKWYRTMTFVQKSTTIKPDGTRDSVTWYEAMSLPGKLRIDIEPIKAGNGILFVNDKQMNFKDGKLANTRDRIHPLMVLGFDVYELPVEQTVEKLRKLGMDLSVIHEDTWQGRPVYVVGAKSGDQTTPQFWIDKQNLYFVRLIERGGKDNSSVQEIQFNKYFKAKGGGWVAPEVVVLLDGKEVFLEEYSEVKTDVKLDDRLFQPESWTSVSWR